MAKRPAFMFYPADWRKDPELRVCSIAARGLWIDMIALMHEGDPYGHLVVNGVAVSDVQLARLVGESVTAVRKLLAELESHNVFSRNDMGVAYSRRMVADEHIRNVRAESGKLGGNPTLMDKGKVKPLVKQTVKQKPTPSVAVAVSPSELLTADAESEGRAVPIIRRLPEPSPDVLAVRTHYKAVHPSRRPGPKDDKAIEKALGFGYTAAELCEAIDGNAADEWYAKKRKHDLPYVLRDSGIIDNFRATPRVVTVVSDGWYTDVAV